MYSFIDSWLAHCTAGHVLLTKFSTAAVQDTWKYMYMYLKVQSGQRTLPPLRDLDIFYFKNKGSEFILDFYKKKLSSLKVEQAGAKFNFYII